MIEAAIVSGPQVEPPRFSIADTERVETMAERIRVICRSPIVVPSLGAPAGCRRGHSCSHRSVRTDGENLIAHSSPSATVPGIRLHETSFAVSRLLSKHNFICAACGRQDPTAPRADRTPGAEIR